MNKKQDKLRVGVDLHNLSTRADLSLRTGIQQVIFGLLDSQFRSRNIFSKQMVELRPLPMLPVFFGKSRFSDLGPSHINNSKIVLEDVSRELGIDPAELWRNAVDGRYQNWNEEEFYESCADLDWLIITGLCEFRHIAEKLKAINPGLKIAVLVYDLGPVTRPELVAEGMNRWFRDCYLESVRHYADLVFTISRHTAIECIRHFSTWTGFKAPVWSAPLPAEPPALKKIEDDTAADFLAKFGLKQNKYFVAIGTIEPRKNLGIAVLGFNRFCRLDPEFTKDFRFVVIGKQGWRNEDTRILELIGDNVDRFVFPGYLPREEVELAILQSSGLVMPSRLEGFGLPVALATAYNVPTVTCNNTSLPEASGVSSLFVTTDSPDRMALALWSLASTETRQTFPCQNALMMNQTRSRAEWDRYLQNWLDCIVSFGTHGTEKEGKDSFAAVESGSTPSAGVRSDPFA